MNQEWDLPVGSRCPRQCIRVPWTPEIICGRDPNSSRAFNLGKHFRPPDLVNKETVPSTKVLLGFCFLSTKQQVPNAGMK